MSDLNIHFCSPLSAASSERSGARRARTSLNWSFPCLMNLDRMVAKEKISETEYRCTFADMYPDDLKYGLAFGFAKRFLPILDAFDKVDVNFGLEVHPTEIAFDTASAERAIEAVNGHRRFGFNYDPSHLGYQGVDYVQFIRKFSNRIFHVHMKDVWWGHGDGSVGVFGGHTTFTDPRRHGDFRSLGHGDINFEEIIVALNDIQYKGPLSIEWEDGRMDRFHGAEEACAFTKKVDFKPNEMAFDAAFDTDNQ